MRYIKKEGDIHIVEKRNLLTLFKTKTLRLYEYPYTVYLFTVRGCDKMYINADTGAVYGRCLCIERESKKR